KQLIKMKRTLVILFVLFFASFGIRAQYDISLEIKNCQTDTMYIGYFYLGGTYAFDTCVAKKGKFRFKKKDKPMPEGMYFFSDNKGKYIEFIVGKENKMNFYTTNEDWAENMMVKGSKDEQLYFDYIKKSNLLSKEFRALSTKTNDKETYDKELKILSEKNDKLKEDFIRDNPEHLLSKILNCSRPINVPQVETILTSDGAIDSMAMRIRDYTYYKKHYFDNIDLSCDALIRTPKEIFLQPYTNYWEKVMKYERADSLLYYADSLISLTKEGGEMYKYFINDVTKRYLTDNVMGHDKVYVGMVNKYFKEGKVTWMHTSDVEMNIQRAERWEKILVGETIPDLACPIEDENSKWHSLGELNNRYRVLIFWSIECGHCTKEIPQLAQFYNNNKEKYDIGIFGVHTEGDLAQMKEFCQKYGINWVNTNGLFANYDWREYFDIEKTPVIFILDNKNKILAKNVSIESLQQIFDLLEKDLLNL
ncbi:MAG: thioredoxin-like domain-containing protein, partial [Bacteroidota bacterium]|nr:thioredoxin-like domain-containing protein [Bacteroidota bacterium]